jgi:hypothetical protein
VGKALAITGMRRLEEPFSGADANSPAGATNSSLYFVTNNGVAGTCAARIFSTTQNAVETFTATTQTINLLSMAPGEGSPTGIRSMKAGVGVLNVTPALTRGGRVYILNCDARIQLPKEPTIMTAADWAGVRNVIREHPDCVAFSGSEFSKQKDFFCHIADTADYENFNPYLAPQSINGFFQGVATWNPTTGAVSPQKMERPMSTLCILVDIPPANQDYTLTFYASYYTRWPLNTVPNLVSSDIPSANTVLLDKLAREAMAGADPERQR